MWTEALMVAKPHCITAYVLKFRHTRSLLPLLGALILVIRQRRTLELLYGVYCYLFHRPSPVCPSEKAAAWIPFLKQKPALTHQRRLSRVQIIELYGAAFKASLLPPDFQGARCESIWHENERLIIGEYGDDSRIACITPELCVISDHYRHVPGVKHIHSIEGYGDSGEFLVSTGDSKKFLDLWTVRDAKMNFVRRLSKRLAGFTAAARVNGEYYFGTDFSSRPNFIAKLGGTKYFFPKKAYKFQVIAFHPFFDRYIVSINTEFQFVGGRYTLSIFDTVDQRFIYCEYWTPEESRNEDREASGTCPSASLGTTS